MPNYQLQPAVITAYRYQPTTNMTPAIGTQAAGLPNLSSWSNFGNSYGQGLITSLTDFGLNWLGSVIQNKQQRNMIDYQNKIWKQNYAMQREDALEDYAMQRKDYLSDLANEREYNSASSVKARLLDAGINPNSMSGQFSTASSAAQNTADVRSSGGAAPSGSAATWMAGGLANQVAPMMNTSLIQLRGRLLDADRQKVEADTIKSLSEGKGQDLKNIAQGIANRFLAQEKARNLDYLMYSTQKIISEQMLIDYQRNNTEPAKVEKINAEVSKVFREMEYLKTMCDYYDAIGDKINVEKRLAEFQENVLNPLAAALKGRELGYYGSDKVIGYFTDILDSLMGAYGTYKGSKSGKSSGGFEYRGYQSGTYEIQPPYWN